MKTKTLILTAAFGLTGALALGQISLAGLNTSTAFSFSGFEGTYDTLPSGVTFTTGQSERGFFDYNNPPGLSNLGIYAFRETENDPVLGFVHRRGAASPANQYFNISYTNNTGQVVNDFDMNLDFLQISEGRRATEILINWNPGSGFTSAGVTNGQPFVASSDSNITSLELLNPYVAESRTISFSSVSGIADGSTVIFRFNIRNGDGSGNNSHVGFSDITVTAIPEPGTLALVLLTGIAALVSLRRKRT